MKLYSFPLSERYDNLLIWFQSSDLFFWSPRDPRSNMYNKMAAYTDNPLYTYTWYNDKIHYNDNLTVTKPSLKR